MTEYNLDELKQVQLRDIWHHEALNFTKWLAEEPSLKLLSAAVGIELELIETESSIGAFSVDIYAQEIGTGRKVVIENQLAPPTTTIYHLCGRQGCRGGHLGGGTSA